MRCSVPDVVHQHDAFGGGLARTTGVELNAQLENVRGFENTICFINVVRRIDDEANRDPLADGFHIGEHTVGSTGQPYITQFDDGITVAIGAKRAYFPDGSQFEGIGIMPDIEIVPSTADLGAGRDPVLEKALEIATKS